jgi:hypothetical protein
MKARMQLESERDAKRQANRADAATAIDGRAQAAQAAQAEEDTVTPSLTLVATPQPAPYAAPGPGDDPTVVREYLARLRPSGARAMRSALKWCAGHNHC